MDRYEIKEGLWRPFVVSESPHVLKNQKLNVSIYVKAIDKAGNERLVIVSPQNEALWWNDPAIIILAIGALILVVFGVIKWLRRRDL